MTKNWASGSFTRTMTGEGGVSWRAGRICRRGFSRVEALVTIVVIVTLIGIAIPAIYRGTLRLRKNACAFNLRAIGQALDAYQTTHNGVYPCGSSYQHQPASPWGTTWWVSVLPYTEKTSPAAWQQVASSGDFAGSTVNPNLAAVNGVRPTVMYCPSSPLPPGNDPKLHISEVNRQALNNAVRGLPVPSYVAIAGSAPDMLNLAPSDSIAAPSGRNTDDGPYGVLSASGAFPPDRPLRQAALRDGLGHVILVGEQSNWGYDNYTGSQVRYDLRSAWPAGAFQGAGGNYDALSPTVSGINGSGDARCFNITTVRYPINTVDINAEYFRAGIVAQPVTAIPNTPRGKRVRQLPERPPGPGHNHGIFSAHAGGAHVLFADGHVEFKSEAMDLATLLMLATRDDGNVMTDR